MLFQSWEFSYSAEKDFNKDLLFFHAHYRFSVKPITDEHVYVFNAHAEVCLEPDDCSIKIPIMKNTKLPTLTSVITGSNKSRSTSLNFFAKHE